ncbi:XRE family transcriptional regulator [Actinomadura formosensis]|uniref:XRE family transcriptional regulator n=1 Tax=Actinomadura formosensis TaxID=60706 RepID=UPI000AEAEA6C|nr:XRE family transcriptional regulator [Actinomadura formosensis]
MTTDDARRAQAVRLKTERERRGWGVRRMARFLRDAVDDHQKPELPSFVTYVKRWESGAVEITDARYRAAYARVLGIPESDLLGPTPAAALSADGELAGLVPDRKQGGDRNTSLAGTLVGSPAPNQEDDVRRRAALQVIAALSAGVAIPPGTIETALSGVEEAFGNPLDVAEWERLVSDYDYRLHISPAGAMVGDLTSDLVAMGELFKRRLPPLQQAGLLRVCAALSGLLAIEFVDANDQRSARIVWATAIRAADASGDREMQIWTRGRAAQDAFFAGRSPSVVAKLVDEAVQIAGGAPSFGLARAYVARTCLAVHQNDNEGVRVSLADLNRTCESMSNSSIGQSVFEYREAQRLWAESYAYVHIGDKRAESSLTQARALYPVTAFAPQANLALMQAVSLVKECEIANGLQLALDTLQVQTRGSAGGRLLARSIVGLLPGQARALPEVREIHALSDAV